MDPPTIAPACAAAERRHLGVWSACAAERKCIAPYAHIVLLDLVYEPDSRGCASSRTQQRKPTCAHGPHFPQRGAVADCAGP